jgi:hypothetical protein
MKLQTMIQQQLLLDLSTEEVAATWPSSSAAVAGPRRPLHWICPALLESKVCNLNIVHVQSNL